ncbi:MAG TPA: M23 family metallopeptidase, partial [Thermoanaerobaculia bacterium]|nr:M23 family metallopeptidase [Thermoanaerobaculia bacterium]
MRRAVLIGLLLVVAIRARGAEAVRVYRDVPVNIQAPVRPLPVKARDGRWYLAYHLLVTNLAEADLTVSKVVVRDARDGKEAATYGEPELKDGWKFESPLLYGGNRPPEWTVGLIPGGQTAGLFFWLVFPDRRDVPERLFHDITFAESPAIRIASRDGMSVRGYEVPLAEGTPLVLDPPLLGGPWKCANGPGYNTAHQVVVPVHGKARMPQRFAIDFMKVDASGNTLPNPFPDEITNAMFYGYGAAVVAVADGVIARVVDGIAENVPQASGKFVPAVPMTRETVSGNWLALTLKGNQYAFYAHLRPGSIRVKAGQRVRRGQVLAELGNSGNAVGPHLHFHVGDAIGESLNENEGLPFVFRSFAVLNSGDKHV